MSGAGNVGTGDPVEALLNSPRSLKAMEKLGIKKDEVQFVGREELKARLGNMKISKHDLDHQWQQHEQQRKDKIQQILDVTYNLT
jgi:hypothetical protein